MRIFKKEYAHISKSGTEQMQSAELVPSEEEEREFCVGRGRRFYSWYKSTAGIWRLGSTQDGQRMQEARWSSEKNKVLPAHRTRHSYKCWNLLLAFSKNVAPLVPHLVPVSLFSKAANNLAIIHQGRQGVCCAKLQHRYFLIIGQFCPKKQSMEWFKTGNVSC